MTGKGNNTMTEWYRYNYIVFNDSLEKAEECVKKSHGVFSVVKTYDCITLITATPDLKDLEEEGLKTKDGYGHICTTVVKQESDINDILSMYADYTNTVHRDMLPDILAVVNNVRYEFSDDTVPHELSGQMYITDSRLAESVEKDLKSYGYGFVSEKQAGKYTIFDTDCNVLLFPYVLEDFRNGSGYRGISTVPYKGEFPTEEDIDKQVKGLEDIHGQMSTVAVAVRATKNGTSWSY